MLGRGTFGTVFEGNVFGGGGKVAVKRFHDGDHVGMLMLQLKRTLAALRAANSWVASGCWVVPAAVAANKSWGGEVLLMPLLRQQALHAPQEELVACLASFCDELDRVGAVHVDLCRRNILWSGSGWEVVDFDAAFVVSDAPRLEPPRGTLCPYGEGHGAKIWRPAACRFAMRFAACATVAKYIPKGGSFTREQLYAHYGAVEHVGLCPPELLREAADALFPKVSAWQR